MVRPHGSSRWHEVRGRGAGSSSGGDEERRRGTHKSLLPSWADHPSIAGAPLQRVQASALELSERVEEKGEP